MNTFCHVKAKFSHHKTCKIYTKLFFFSETSTHYVFVVNQDSNYYNSDFYKLYVMTLLMIWC